MSEQILLATEKKLPEHETQVNAPEDTPVYSLKDDLRPERISRSQMIVDEGRVAYHGLLANLADRRMRKAGNTMARMEHKDALYADLGAQAQTHRRTVSKTPTGQAAMPQTLIERVIDRRLDKRSMKKADKDVYAYRMQSIFGDHETMKGVSDHERKQQAKEVHRDAKRGVITARERRERLTEIEAQPLRLGEKPVKHTEHQAHRAQKRLNRAIRQPFSSRWRSWRHERAIGIIQQSHAQAERHKALTEKQTSKPERQKQWRNIPLTIDTETPGWHIGADEGWQPENTGWHLGADEGWHLSQDEGWDTHNLVIDPEQENSSNSTLEPEVIETLDKQYQPAHGASPATQANNDIAKNKQSTHARHSKESGINPYERAASARKFALEHIKGDFRTDRPKEVLPTLSKESLEGLFSKSSNKYSAQEADETYAWLVEQGVITDMDYTTSLGTPSTKRVIGKSAEELQKLLDDLSQNSHTPSTQIRNPQADSYEELLKRFPNA